MSHYMFDVDHAVRYGMEEAVLIQHFSFWISKNKANGKNVYDGRTWTYMSQVAFEKWYPFWSGKQIRRIIKSLCDQGVIITGRHGKSQYDRTLWYAFREESVYISSICPNGQMEPPKRANGTAQTGKSYTDIDTDIYTDKNDDTRAREATSRPAAAARQTVVVASSAEAAEDIEVAEIQRIHATVNETGMPIPRSAIRGMIAAYNPAAHPDAQSETAVAGIDRIIRWVSAQTAGQPPRNATAYVRTLAARGMDMPSREIGRQKARSSLRQAAEAEVALRVAWERQERVMPTHAREFLDSFLRGKSAAPAAPEG